MSKPEAQIFHEVIPNRRTHRWLGADLSFHCVTAHTHKSVWFRLILYTRTEYGRTLAALTLPKHRLISHMYVEMYMGSEFMPFILSWKGFSTFTSKFSGLCCTLNMRVN